jgi:hypothetical protein
LQPIGLKRASALKIAVANERIVELNRQARMLTGRRVLNDEALKPLDRFRGTRVVLQIIKPPDLNWNRFSEVMKEEDFARSFLELSFVGWKVDLAQSPDPGFDAHLYSRRCETGNPPCPKGSNPTPAFALTSRSWMAGEALKKYLESDLGLMASVEHWTLDTTTGEIQPQFKNLNLPPGVLVVRIGVSELAVDMQMRGETDLR